MISNAGIEEARVEASRYICKSCGHSWLRRDEKGSHICPVCNTPNIEDEEKNVIRKN